jgi:hypothetical protein
MRRRHRSYRASIASWWRWATPKERVGIIALLVVALAFSAAMFVLKAKIIVWIGGM